MLTWQVRCHIDACEPSANLPQLMSRALIIIGLAIAAVGLLWPWIARLGLGRLPGDIWIHRGNFTFYAPITTSILVSLALSLVLWLLSR